MIESKLLGQKVAYPTTYAPDILLPVPRSLNREIYGIGHPDELFCGYDAWHVYEVSCLLDNGLPMCGVAKIVYPANSPYLVESKSLKLYFASFNMYAMGATRSEAVGRLEQTVATDLSKALQTSVRVHFYAQAPSIQPFDFADYRLLETLPEAAQTAFDTYSETPSLLIAHPRESSQELKVYSHLLKSNCKITGQPDWGSIFVRMKGHRLPYEMDLLRYIVSIRNENHFHEEICEMAYKRLFDLFAPEILMVSCLYTRRGGIDICPARANAPEYLPKHLIEAETITQQTFRQ